MFNSFDKRNGFTIVELLIVIVVVGILAAITVVAYSGIQERARVASASSALSQASKKLSLYMVDNATYPDDLATAGIRDSSSVTYQYSVNKSVTPQLFCITATSGSTSYSIGQGGNPVSGGCAGHGTGGKSAITNQVTNPSFELNTEGWIAGGDVGNPVANRIAGGPAGSFHLTLSKASPVGSAQYNYIADGLKPETVYRVSFWAWADTAGPTNTILLARNNGAFTGFIWLSPTLTTTPTFYTATGTSPVDSTQMRLRVTPRSDGSLTHYDGFMVTETAASTGYADGSSANWIWNGIPNASTSTGSPY